jgi:hypothetical protein
MPSAQPASQSSRILPYIATASEARCVDATSDSAVAASRLPYLWAVVRSDPELGAA